MSNEIPNPFTKWLDNIVEFNDTSLFAGTPEDNAQVNLIKQIKKKYLELFPFAEQHWMEVDYQVPTGVELLGFNESWKDADYNPDGICVFYIQDNGVDEPREYIVAKWCGYHDCWHTRGTISDTVSHNYAETIQAPTHWMFKPKLPK